MSFLAETLLGRSTLTGKGRHPVNFYPNPTRKKEKTGTEMRKEGESVV
jgi:hypothetical protein